MAYTALSGHQRQVGTRYGEQAACDNARYVVDIGFQTRRVVDFQPRHVQYPTAVIGGKTLAQSRRAAKPAQLPRNSLKRHGYDFDRSEEHTYELQSLMRISSAVF